jgi:hypothetical protein
MVVAGLRASFERSVLGLRHLALSPKGNDFW